MSASDVIKMIKDNDVKFVELRFTDTIGKEQHVTVPAHEASSSFFKDGKIVCVCDKNRSVIIGQHCLSHNYLH